MIARRLTVATLASLCTLAGLFALTGGSAQAAVSHEFLSAVSAKLNEGVPAAGPHGEAVPVPGSISEPKSMTVDSGELYVAEGNGESRIDKFNASSGAFLAQFPQLSSPTFLHQGVTVGHSTGEAQVYVAGDESTAEGTKGVVAVLDPAGSVLGVWKGMGPEPSETFGCFECFGPGSIAVDANPSSLNDWAAGDVYVADLEKKVVDVFKPLTGGGREYVTQLTGPEPPGVLFSKPRDVAVNPSNGEVLIVDRENGSDSVDLFKPAPISGQYEYVGKLTGPPPSGSFGPVHSITVDGGNGDIFIAEGEAVGVVDEFDAAGAYVGRLRGTPTGPGGELRPFKTVLSVAVDPLSHRLFVGDYSGGEGATVDVFGPDIVLPDVTTGASEVSLSAEGEIEAKLNGTVKLDKEGPATCWFVWGTTKAFGASEPCSAQVSAEESAVHTVIGGLLPDTGYVFRLQASNKNGTNPGEEIQDTSFTTPGPGLHSESTSNVAATSAILEASIDPHGASTSYYFQYGTSSAYGGQIPGAPASLGAGSGPPDVEVSQHLQELTAATLYHYRVVAVSELEVEGVLTPVAFYGEDKTFTTQSSGVAFTLPDSRQWELVSPVDKHGSSLLPIPHGFVQASTAGDAISYLGTLPTEDHAQGYPESVQVLSKRGAGGWSSKDIALPHASASGATGTEYSFFSDDLSSALVEPRGEFTSLAPEVFPPDTERTEYIRHNSTCAATPATCFEPLLTGAPDYANVPEGTHFGAGIFNLSFTNVVGATPDLAHVILSSHTALTATATNGRTELYEWSAAAPPGEPLQLISQVKDEPVGGVGEAAHLGYENTNTRNAISTDGTRVVWSEQEGTGGLYVRDVALEKTVQLNVPVAACVPANATCGAGTSNTLFQDASSDGSRVFFTDTQRLTPDSGAVSGKPDLYVCELEVVGGELECNLTDLTPAAGGAPADVQGTTSGVSTDGSWVYFVANGALTAGAAPGSCNGAQPKPGAVCDLYVRHLVGGVWGAPVLVAVLSAGDYPDFSAPLEQFTVRVSENGLWLGFMSQRGLTGYDTRDAVTGLPDEEVYLYHADPSGGAGRLVCASCDPSGARPVGVESAKIGENGLVFGDEWHHNQGIAANIPGFTKSTSEASQITLKPHQPRYLANSGRLFFNSSDALVSGDVNRNQDVYEFEPAGVGGCSAGSGSFREGVDGCLGLVSSGVATGESAFLDASESGDDVFFLTTGRLAAQDVDTSLDVYDAHVCSAAVPCLPSLSVPPACVTADACRAAPAPAPGIFGLPASATFSGAGNPPPPPAATPKTAAQLRAERLSKALKACRRQHSRHKRAVCEHHARKRYGPTKAKKAGHTTTAHRGGK